jgi:hypothetical protein
MLLNARDNVSEAKRHLRRILFRTQRALADAEDGIPIQARDVEPIAQSLRSLMRQVRTVGAILDEWQKHAARYAEEEGLPSSSMSPPSDYD